MLREGIKVRDDNTVILITKDMINNALKAMLAEYDNIYGYHGHLDTIEYLKKERDRFKVEIKSLKEELHDKGDCNDCSGGQ